MASGRKNHRGGERSLPLRSDHGLPAGNRIRGFDGIRVGVLGIDGLRRAGVAAGGVVPAPEPAGGDQSHAGGEQGDCRCDHALDGGAGVGEPGPVTVPVIGVADHLGVGADEHAVDRDRVIGRGRLVLAVERIRVGDDAFDQRGAGDRDTVGVMVGHALEDAPDLDALAGLEDMGVPVGGVFEVGDLACVLSSWGLRFVQCFSAV